MLIRLSIFLLRSSNVILLIMLTDFNNILKLLLGLMLMALHRVNNILLVK